MREIEIIAVDDLKSLEVKLIKLKNTIKDVEQVKAIDTFLLDHERIFEDATMKLSEIMDYALDMLKEKIQM